MTTLTAMLGTYPKTAPLKDGRVTSPEVTLQFAPVDTAQKAFKQVVRDHAFDVAELAIMTFLQAFEAGAPYVLLPYVMNGGFHHKSLLTRADSNVTTSTLKRVAMRAYSQTTPAWVRGILVEDYGVSLRDVQWLSQEGAHVAGYQEPPWVARMEPGVDLERALLAGDVDAIISGAAREPDPMIRTVIPNAGEAALDWHRRTRVVPINHIVTIRSGCARHARAVYDMLDESRTMSGDRPDGLDLQPKGFEALQPALEMAIRFAYDQKLIQTTYKVDKLYGDVAGALGRR